MMKYKLDQLDEELRVAFGWNDRPGLVWRVTAGEQPRIADPNKWNALTPQQRATFDAVLAAHVPVFPPLPPTRTELAREKWAAAPVASKNPALEAIAIALGLQD